MKLSIVISPVFSEAVNKLIKAEVPISTAYKLKSVVKTLGEEQKKFEDLRTSLIEKYAPKNKKGEIVKNEDGGYAVAEKNKEAFFEEIKELLNVEVELPKIKVSELGTKLEMSAQDLTVLEGLLEE